MLLDDLSMALTHPQQFFRAIETARRPLLVLSENPSVDDYVTALAIRSLFLKLEKEIDIATSAGPAPESLGFLRETGPVHGDLPNLKKLTIKVQARDTKIDELSYNMQGDELHIHLLPKSGTWNESDIHIATDHYRYDTVVIIGCQDLEQMGALYRKYTDFFHSVTLLNLDHSAGNEGFGHVNFLDLRAVSNSEIFFHLLHEYNESLIDSELATHLLAGMIAKTRSFKSDDVTPHTLKTASHLFSKGARREEIVKHLYKTRSVSTLRLWGRALARLKASDGHRLVWTMLTREDFARAGAELNAVSNVVDELMLTSADAQIGVVFWESGDDIEAIIHAMRPHDALLLGAPYKASGTRNEVRIRLKGTKLGNAESQVIERIKREVKAN